MLLPAFADDDQHVRIYLCDDVPELRQLLRLVLEEEQDLEVVGEAGDAESGIEGIAELQPDVVVLDLSMPGTDGFATIGDLLVAAPATRVVVMSGFMAHEVADRVLALGASAYLEKGVRLDLSSALLEVLAA